MASRFRLVSVLNLRRGDLAAALAAAEQSATIDEKNLGRVVALGTEEQKRLYLDRLAEPTDAIVSLHVDLAPPATRSAQCAREPLQRSLAHRSKSVTRAHATDR